MNIRLVHNPDRTLLGVIAGYLAAGWSRRLDAAVSYVHLSGVALLYDELTKFVDDGFECRFIVAVDQGITSFEGLRMLLATGATVYVYRGQSHSYHAKTWLFSDGANARAAVIGSGNMTSGGLVRSIEIASQLDAEDGTDTAWLDELRLVIDRIAAGGQRIADDAGLVAVRARFGIPSERDARERSDERKRRGALGTTPGLKVAIPPAYGTRAKAWITSQVVSAEARPTRPSVVRAIENLQGLDVEGVIIVANPLRRPRTPGELRLPVPSLRLAPAFWNWPRSFKRVVRKGDTYDERHADFRFESAGDAPSTANVRIYAYPRRGEFRLTSAEFRSRADGGDLIVITRGSGATPFRARVVRQADPDYAQYRAMCTIAMPGGGGRVWSFI